MGRETQFFFDLIEIAIGNKAGIDKTPTDKEWVKLYNLACMQSLASVVLEGVNKLSLSDSSLKPPMDFLYEWIGIQQQTVAQNKLQNQKTKELCEIFKKAGYRCCVLKGQGTALYYEHPEYRQCGDIDIWVTKDGRCKTDDVRSEVLQFAKSQIVDTSHAVHLQDTTGISHSCQSTLAKST